MTMPSEPCLRPSPGPQYWNWRCLTCSFAIADHLGWWQRLNARRAERRAGKDVI